MEIVNDSDQDVTWFCYNSNDLFKTFHMAAGDVPANGGRISYDPKSNATGQYYMKITVKGGGGGTVFVPSGTLGHTTVPRNGAILVKGSCEYQVVRGPQRAGGPIEIVNESDMAVTWWCYNSDDVAEEFTHKYADLSKGGRVSYSPPGNKTGAYTVLITPRGSHAPYRWWAPDEIKGRAGDVPPGATIIFRGSCGYIVMGGIGVGPVIG
ncbi:MAG: hypothetical protein ACREJ0_19615 [Geminicoccaceae bacterium]